MKTETITDSISLTDFIGKFKDVDQQLTWNKRRKQPGKMLLSAIMAYYLKDDSEGVSSSGCQKVVDLLKAKGHSGYQTNADQTQAFATLCDEVERMWGLQFNPCSSVIGSVLSQEVIKVIT